jgi:FixJ family two-component response regulator
MHVNGADRLGAGMGLLTGANVISIIDDDAAVRSAVDGLVRSFGYTFRTFESAEEFLEYGVEGTSYLVCDVQLPGRDGIKLCQELRRRGYRIPVTFLTTYPDEAVRKRAELVGATAFPGKPFDSVVLMDHVARTHIRTNFE